MAVLEAFVYDPLLNWRLMDTAPKAKTSTRPKTGEPGESAASSQEPADNFLEEAVLSVSVAAKKIPTSSLETPAGMLINI